MLISFLLIRWRLFCVSTLTCIYLPYESVWFAAKMAFGGGICWRKKWSSLHKKGQDSSISYVYHSNITATVMVACISYSVHPLCTAPWMELYFWIDHSISWWLAFVSLCWVYDGVRDICCKCGISFEMKAMQLQHESLDSLEKYQFCIEIMYPFVWMVPSPYIMCTVYDLF